MNDRHSHIVRDPDGLLELLALGLRAHAKRERECVPVRVFCEVGHDEAPREACSSGSAVFMSEVKTHTFTTTAKSSSSKSRVPVAERREEGLSEEFARRYDGSDKGGSLLTCRPQDENADRHDAD